MLEAFSFGKTLSEMFSEVNRRFGGIELVNLKYFLKIKQRMNLFSIWRLSPRKSDEKG
jgi:hypothetical protein